MATKSFVVLAGSGAINMLGIEGTPLMGEGRFRSTCQTTRVRIISNVRTCSPGVMEVVSSTTSPAESGFPTDKTVPSTDHDVDRVERFVFCIRETWPSSIKELLRDNAAPQSVPKNYTKAVCWVCRVLYPKNHWQSAFRGSFTSIEMRVSFSLRTYSHSNSPVLSGTISLQMAVLPAYHVPISFSEPSLGSDAEARKRINSPIGSASPS